MKQILALRKYNIYKDLNIDRKRFVKGENKHIDSIDQRLGLT